MHIFWHWMKNDRLTNTGSPVVVPLSNKLIIAHVKTRYNVMPNRIYKQGFDWSIYQLDVFSDLVGSW